MAVQTAAGILTWSVGNALTQTHRKEQEHIDWKEVAIYAAYGPLLSNFGHTWYRHLHVFTNRTLRMSTWQMISTKLAADALVFGPMHVTALLTWTHFLNARPAQDLPGVFKSQFLSMVAAEATIWTPVQYLNFTLLPVQHQQMFVNVVTILEAAVLSWLAEDHSNDHSEKVANESSQQGPHHTPLSQGNTVH